MRALGVTCGIGSMLIGARQVGFEVIGNIEWRNYYHFKDEQGRNTFIENFPGAFFCHNIEELSEKKLEQIKRIDLAIGHPECGGFSVMNQSRKKTENNPGDIPLFVDLIKKIQPKYFVQDNLPRSLIGYPLSQWVENLSEYDIFPEWISNYNYGNIQKSRNRLFIIGALKSEKFIFHPGEKENNQTLKNCLKNCKGLPNHNLHINKGPCGKNRFSLSDKKYGEFRKYGEFVGEEGASKKATWHEFKRYFTGKPDGHVMLYVTTDGIIRRRIGTSKGYYNGYSHLLDGSSCATHPRRNLPFTLRERARIQGSPDDFIFYGEKFPWNHEKNQAMIKQTGKFMPVEFCKYISKQIAAHIQKKKFQCSNKRLIKSNKFIDEAKQWYCKNIGYSYHGHKHEKEICNACWLNC